MTVNRSDFQSRFKAEPDSGDRFIGMDTDDGSGDPFITDLAGMAGGLAPLIAVDTELSSRFASGVFLVDWYLPAGTTPSSATSAQTLAAYNAARDAAYAVGGTVKFTPGRTYQIDTTFVIKSNMTFDCSGATLKKRSTTGKLSPLIANETWSGSGNTGITIIAPGATFSYNGGNLVSGSGEPYGGLGNITWFQNVQNFRIVGRPTFLRSGGGGYALTIGHASNVEVEGAHFDTVSDGVHLLGPVSMGKFGTFSGTTGDDFFAMTISDYTAQVSNLTTNGETVTAGDIEDITIEALIIDNDAMPTEGASTGSGLSMLSGDASYWFRRIHVGSILGKSKRAARLTNDGYLTSTQIDDVTIDKIDVTLGTGVTGLVSVDCDAFNSLTIGEFNNNDSGNTSVLALYSTIGSVNIGRLTQEAACTAGLITVNSGCTLKALHIGSAKVVFGTNGRLVDLGNASATLVTLDDFDLSGSTAGWGFYANAAGPHTVMLSNGTMRSMVRVGRIDSPGVVTVIADGVQFDTCLEHINCGTGGTVRMIYGGIRQVASSDRTLSGSGTFSATGPAFKCTASALNGAAAGDIVYNVSGGAGAGLVEYDGSSWARFAKVNSSGALTAAGASLTDTVTITANNKQINLRNDTNMGLEDNSGALTVKAPGNVVINADADSSGAGSVFVASQGNNYIVAGPVHSGVMIGVSGTSAQKLGFHGTTPITRQSGTPAAATDLATAITLVNDLRTKLLALGLFT